jgi:integrase
MREGRPASLARCNANAVANLWSRHTALRQVKRVTGKLPPRFSSAARCLSRSQTLTNLAASDDCAFLTPTTMDRPRGACKKPRNTRGPIVAATACAYLLRIHNFALDMDWLLRSIIPKKQWPKVVHAEERAITFEEHQRIIEAETAGAKRNQGSRNSDEPHHMERLLFYKLCWHLGRSQSDIAHLTAQDIDWEDRTIGYNRMKLEGRAVRPPLIHFGDEVAEILRSLYAEARLTFGGALMHRARRIVSRRIFRRGCQSAAILNTAHVPAEPRSIGAAR